MHAGRHFDYIKQDQKRRDEIVKIILNDQQDFVRLDQGGALDRVYIPEKNIITAKIIERIAAAGIDVSGVARGRKYYGDLGELILSLPQGIACDLSLHNFLPSKKVHLMGKKRGMFFDFKNCDTVAELLDEAGESFRDDGCYFDFGCSSGRTVRTFHASMPKTAWVGADPVNESIQCASILFPFGTWITSVQEPPVPQTKESKFDGAVALSVWSHFSAGAGERWLREMARIVKPGGFFAVSMIGYFQIAKQLLLQAHEFSLLDRAFDGLEKEGFFFANTIKDGHRGLETVDWGLTFVTPKWVKENWLGDDWELGHYQPGRWGDKQDMYLLKRR